MMRAIELAKKAEGRTSPNPPVGCVIVKNGKIIAEGYHKKAGLAHAEIEALKKTRSARGAAMYVTLEPCDHYGKTPPCTKAIIDSKIKKVIIAIKDPNRINNGRGIKKLRKHKIQIKTGVCRKEALDLYRPYIKFVTGNTPFISLKLAESLDGKIATRSGESKWISGRLSRNYVQKLRQKADAILVGINTVMKDDPSLLITGARDKRPVRIVLDSDLMIPLNSKLVKTLKFAPLIIAAKAGSSDKKKKILEKKGIIVLTDQTKAKEVNLRKILRKLARKNIMHILCEGGSGVAGALLDGKFVDRVYFFISPKLLGGRNAVTSIGGNGISSISKAVEIQNREIKMFGQDIMVKGDVYWNNRRNW